MEKCQKGSARRKRAKNSRERTTHAPSSKLSVPNWCFLALFDQSSRWFGEINSLESHHQPVHLQTSPNVLCLVFEDNSCCHCHHTAEIECHRRGTWDLDVWSAECALCALIWEMVDGYPEVNISHCKKLGIYRDIRYGLEDFPSLMDGTT